MDQTGPDPADPGRVHADLSTWTFEEKDQKKVPRICYASPFQKPLNRCKQYLYSED